MHQFAEGGGSLWPRIVRGRWIASIGAIGDFGDRFTSVFGGLGFRRSVYFWVLGFGLANCLLFVVAFRVHQFAREVYEHRPREVDRLDWCDRFTSVFGGLGFTSWR